MRDVANEIDPSDFGGKSFPISCARITKRGIVDRKRSKCFASPA